MKKTLLFLGLLGLASNVHAQGPWTLVNTPTTNFFGQYNIVDLHTLSPTLVWGVTSERVAPTAPPSIPGTCIVTNNSTGAGNLFDFNSVSVASDGATPVAHSATVGNISGISATTAVAAAYPGGTFVSATGGATIYGGEITRTTNGGQTWTKATSATQFVGNGSFCNWVCMLTPLIGVSLGDPTGGTANRVGVFEILRTTDGGVTWTRLTGAAVPTPLTNEFGNAGSFFASNSDTNIMWTGLASSNNAAQVRTMKTIDGGVTWTVSGLIPNIVGSVSQLAFKSNNLDGIAYGYAITGSGSSAMISGVNYARTNDGGATWSAITPINTATGSFFRNSIDAVNGTYYSTGPRYPLPTPPAPQAPEDFGFSSSTDGVNWKNITTSGTTLAAPGYFFCMDLIPTSSTTAMGYAGLYTDANGVGGIYKTNTAVLATRNTAVQSTLNVYPNPSTSGVFKVDFGSTLKAGAQLTVIDAMGRQVSTQTLSATAIGSQTVSLDLSGEKTGVYTLQIRTDVGIATQKIVID